MTEQSTPPIAEDHAGIRAAIRALVIDRENERVRRQQAPAMSGDPGPRLAGGRAMNPQPDQAVTLTTDPRGVNWVAMLRWAAHVSGTRATLLLGKGGLEIGAVRYLPPIREIADTARWVGYLGEYQGNGRWLYAADETAARAKLVAAAVRALRGGWEAGMPAGDDMPRTTTGPSPAHVDVGTQPVAGLTVGELLGPVAAEFDALKRRVAELEALVREDGRG